MKHGKKSLSNRGTMAEQRETLLWSKEQEEEINALAEYIASVADEVEINIPEFDFFK